MIFCCNPLGDDKSFFFIAFKHFQPRKNLFQSHFKTQKPPQQFLMCLLKLLSPHYTPLQKILSLNRFHYFKSPWKDNENTLNFLMCYENTKKQNLKSISSRKILFKYTKMQCL